MFERLTHRSKYGIAYTKIAVNESNMVDVGECYTGRIIDRLAAYEDSGLSPEEVVKIKKCLNMWVEICKENNVSIVQFKKWAEAEQDGRLVVLPCKVGDIVYELTDCFDSGIGCKGNCDECPKCRQIIKTVVRTKAHAVRIAERGLLNKTVFLTREEAEKALGGDTP